MAKSLFEKIWVSHEISKIGEESVVAIDRIFLHERTGASALNSLKQSGRTLKSPENIFAVIDHIVDTRIGRDDETLMPGGKNFILETRAAAKVNKLTLIDIDDENHGITHVISPELGIVLPGLTLVAPDSHTCTQGAFGALSWGIGSSEAEHAMATRTLRLKKPKSMRISVNGDLNSFCGAKDIILYILAMHGAAIAHGFVVEFAGAVVKDLSIDGRQTLCNMTTEIGAFSGIIEPDSKVVEYLKNRKYAPKNALWEKAVCDWLNLKSDSEALFDLEIQIDASMIKPMISYGTSPEHTIAIGEKIPSGASQKVLDYMGLLRSQNLSGQSIDAVFLGSCTNSRLSDLIDAANVVRNNQIAPNIKKALVVPGSRNVKRNAELLGLDKIFIEAGFEWRDSGCSLCFYAGGEGFEPGSRVLSSTNRNFEGRQGPSIRTHITSPKIVALSAILGKIPSEADIAEL